MAQADPNMYTSRYQRNPEDPPPYHPSAIEQWASRVVRFSSQYNDTSWSANMTLGEPKVYPQHGDIHGAWATAVIDANQYIELAFEIPVKPTAVNIYETLNPGAVVAVKVLNERGKWDVLWHTSSPTRLTQSRIFSPPLKETGSKINQVRLELNCMAARTWCEIDAVQLVGIRDGAVNPADDAGFINCLESLVNKKEFSDVKFEIDGKKLYAHKAILAARSPYFSTMFKGKSEDLVVLKLPSIGSKDMLSILHFIYTNRLPQACDIKSLVQFTEVSTLLGMPDLKTAAMYKLLQSINCTNVVDIILSLNKSDKDDLKEICMTFVADHLAEVSKAPGFDKLPQDILVRAVQIATANMCISPRSSR